MKAVTISITEKFNNDVRFESIIKSIIQNGIERPKTIRKNFNGERFSGLLLFMIVVKSSSFSCFEIIV
jgi:hypothetical protein